jgi:hypothetical protein
MSLCLVYSFQCIINLFTLHTHHSSVRSGTGSNRFSTVLPSLGDQRTENRTDAMTGRTGTEGPVLSVAVQFSLGLFPVLMTGP